MLHELLRGSAYVCQLQFKIVRRSPVLRVRFLYFEGPNAIASSDFDLIVELVSSLPEGHEAYLAALVLHCQGEHFPLVAAFAPSTDRAPGGDAPMNEPSAAGHGQLSDRLIRAGCFFSCWDLLLIQDWFVECF